MTIQERLMAPAPFPLIVALALFIVGLIMGVILL
jgi:hypothetical protein